MTAPIDAIEVRHYQLPLEPRVRVAWDPQPRTRHTVSVTRVCAGELEGVGAGEAMLGLAGSESLFLGRDPTDLARHVAILDNLQFHYGRMWPLEVALWDLTGKLRGQPLWHLLGGDSGRVRLYASTATLLDREGLAALAVDLRAAGFPAIKLRCGRGLDDDLAAVQAVREALGDGTEILVDANQGWCMP